MEDREVSLVPSLHIYLFMCQQSAATPHTHVGVSKPEPMVFLFMC